MNHSVAVVAIIVAGLLLGGCATLSPEDDHQRIQSLASGRIASIPEHAPGEQVTAAEIQRLLAQPLGPAEAVRLALLGNPDIRTRLGRAGLSRAEVIQASRLPNPRVSLGVLDSSESGAQRIIHTGIAFDLMGLLLRSARQDIADHEYQRDTQQIAHDLVELGSRVESAWFQYASARQVARMRTAASDAARLSAQLAERFYKAGNINELHLQREHANATRAQLTATRAELEERRARIALNRLMGLPAEQDKWQALDNLPAVADTAESQPQLLAAARQERLDLKALEAEVAALERALTATRQWRYVADVSERHLTPAGDADLGVEYERESDGERLIGPTLGLRIPLFDQGQASLARAETRLALAREQLQARRLDVEQQVLEALATTEASLRLAQQYRDQLIPQQEAIVARSQEMYNFMFIGAFDLIAAKQQEYDAYQGYIEAVRDYWLGRVELARAVGTTLGLTFEEQPLMPAPLAVEPSPSDDTDHGHHDHHHGH